MKFFSGSIIKYPIKGFLGIFYYHMGIYVSDKKIIHFSGQKKKKETQLL